MVMSLHAGWDFASIGTFTLICRDSSGDADVTITFSSGTYAHIDIDDVVSGTDTGYLCFATALKTALDASALTGTYTVTFSAATCKYTINATTTLSWQIRSNSNALALSILGMDASNHTGNVNGYIYSDNEVAYSLLAASEGRSNDTDVYEPDGVVEDAEADDGTHYATSRYTAPKYRDFEFLFNSKVSTFKSSETTAKPFSFERFQEHARGQVPIGIWDTITTTGIVGYQRAQGTSFRPQRQIPNNDLYWGWPIRIRQVGTTTSIT